MTHEELQSKLNASTNEGKKGNFGIAERLANEVLFEIDKPFSKVKNIPLLRTNLYITLSNIADYQGNYEQSLFLAHNSLHIAEEYNFIECIARAYNQIGIVYYTLGSFEKALEFYSKAIDTFNIIGDKLKIAIVNGNIGNVYNSIGTNDKALEFFNIAINIYKDLENKPGIASVTGNMGNLYDSIGNSKKALECYHIALQVYDELGNKMGISGVTGNIGNVYSGLEFFDKALEYHRKALSISQEIGEKSLIAIHTGNLGFLFSNGKYEEYNAKKAEELLYLALELSLEIGIKALSLELYKSLTDLFENEKQWEEAFIHFKKYLEIKDKINIEEVKKQESIRDQQKAIEIVRTRASAEKQILNNILPEEITARLIKGENPIADHFENVSVLFMDIVDFTPLSTKITAQQLVYLLNSIFTAADIVMREFGLEKIKTIGDAYMAVAGAPLVQENHAERAAQAALKLMDMIDTLEIKFPENYGDKSWVHALPEIKVRIGVHCGPVAAGVVGENKFIYDLWGDAVNTASRMESHGQSGKIQVSDDFRKALLESAFHFEERGKMEIKGKGKMITYFLSKKP